MSFKAWHGYFSLSLQRKTKSIMAMDKKKEKYDEVCGGEVKITIDEVLKKSQNG